MSADSTLYIKYIETRNQAISVKRLKRDSHTAGSVALSQAMVNLVVLAAKFGNRKSRECINSN